MSENASNPKGPPGPKDERLIVAALAASGWNTGRGFCASARAVSERGTTPSWPWKSLNAVSKLGPSSNIGPFPALAYRRYDETRSESRCSFRNIKYRMKHQTVTYRHGKRQG